MRSLSVARLGAAPAIVLSVQARSPDAGARIANAFADLYLQDQRDAKFEAARRGAAWLDARLGKLRTEAESTEAQAQTYRAAHGLMTSSEAGATWTPPTPPPAPRTRRRRPGAWPSIQIQAPPNQQI
jgi:uncharacterized protein involved in exopolysaccharide biosynthesis